jgi:hypothetical protein
MATNQRRNPGAEEESESMSTDNQTDPRGEWTSASDALADSLCQGRKRAQRGIPSVQTDDSRFGNRIHAALACGKADGLTLEEREVFDACQKIELRLVGQFFGSPAAVKTFREQRFWLKLTSPSNNIIQHSGQPDVVYRLNDRLLILEYKTLAGDVPESSKNLQLRDQAVLSVGHFVTIHSVGVAVIQPLVTHTPEWTIYEPADLTRAANEMAARVIASNDLNAKRTPGTVQCKYCRAKAVCLEYQLWAGQMTPAPRSLLDVPVAQWTGEQCALFLENAGIAQAWLDDAKDAVKERVKLDPAAVPGWGLKAGATKETIVDPQACFDRFSALGGSIQQFMQTVSVGKTKLKEAVNEVTGAKGQALDKAIRALTDGIVQVKQNEPSLVKLVK